MREWLVDTADWKKATATNGSGDKTYAAEVEVICRIVSRIRVYKTREGDEIQSEQTVYFDTAEGILLSVHDILVINGVSRLIYGIEPIKNNLGEVYGFEVML